MNEFAVRQRDKKAEDNTEMDGQQQTHGAALAQDKNRKPGQARQEQHRRESRFHAEARRIRVSRNAIFDAQDAEELRDYSARSGAPSEGFSPLADKLRGALEPRRK